MMLKYKLADDDIIFPLLAETVPPSAVLTVKS